MSRSPALLRAWAASDAHAVLDAFVGSGDMREQAGAPIDTLAAAAAWIDGRLGIDPARGRTWAIDLGGVAAGEVALTSIDRRHGTGWISYWLAPAARGRGLATRAVATVARSAFDELGLARLELGHRSNNPGSGAVARRAGFTHEGTERARLEYDGVRHDVERWALLATDPRPQVDPIPGLLGTIGSP